MKREIDWEQVEENTQGESCNGSCECTRSKIENLLVWMSTQLQRIFSSTNSTACDASKCDEPGCGESKCDEPSGDGPRGNRPTGEGK